MRTTFESAKTRATFEFVEENVSPRFPAAVFDVVTPRDLGIKSPLEVPLEINRVEQRRVIRLRCRGLTSHFCFQCWSNSLKT